MIARERLKEAKRIVVKVGTSSLTHSTGRLSYENIERLVRQIADLQNAGKEMVLVTSGAMAAGLGRMNLMEKPTELPKKQALAAVGQGVLMHVYERFFAEYGQTAAQVLLTRENSLRHSQYSHSRNALLALIQMGVIPVINENDAVAVDEFKIGDNDTLSAVVAALVDADALIILSDIEGVYTANPSTHPEAELISEIKEITPESLIKIYKAVGREATGKVAVKISTGEMGGNNYLKPALIEPLLQEVNGRLVECNTAYAGSRMETADHRKTIEAHGFKDVDIMDEEGEIKIPVKDDKWIKYDIVGSHIQNYDFMINLAHFKGHAMGGFGGVLKNASIGVGSRNGKAYIHSAGKTEDYHTMWQNLPAGWDQSPENNTPFIESMAAAAQAVHEYFGEGKNILYIDIMNNISIDCDCDSHPHDPTIQDIGIAASIDPVALDKFCLDQVFNLPNDENNDTKALLDRINQRHGTRIVFRGEEMGLGTTKYTVVNVD